MKKRYFLKQFHIFIAFLAVALAVLFLLSGNVSRAIETKDILIPNDEHIIPPSDYIKEIRIFFGEEYGKKDKYYFKESMNGELEISDSIDEATCVYTIIKDKNGKNQDFNESAFYARNQYESSLSMPAYLGYTTTENPNEAITDIMYLDRNEIKTGDIPEKMVVPNQNISEDNSKNIVYVSVKDVMNEPMDIHGGVQPGLLVLYTTNNSSFGQPVTSDDLYARKGENSDVVPDGSYIKIHGFSEDDNLNFTKLFLMTDDEEKKQEGFTEKDGLGGLYVYFKKGEIPETDIKSEYGSNNSYIAVVPIAGFIIFGAFLLFYNIRKKGKNNE